MKNLPENKIIIRKLKKADLTKLVEFEKHNQEKDFRIGHKGNYTKKDIKRGVDIILNSKVHKIFSLVAEINNKIVGWLELGVKPSTQRKHIGSVGVEVLSDYYKKNVHILLLNELFKMARKIRINILIIDIMETNAIAIKNYKRSGFKIYGRLPKGVKNAGRYIKTIQMYKEI